MNWPHSGVRFGGTWGAEMSGLLLLIETDQDVCWCMLQKAQLHLQSDRVIVKATYTKMLDLLCGRTSCVNLSLAGDS